MELKCKMFKDGKVPNNGVRFYEWFAYRQEHVNIMNDSNVN